MSETAAPCDFTECENNDRHLWPETSPVDAPEEKLFVTSAGGIGINIGGHVIVRPLREWHRLAASQPDREAIAERVYQAFPFEPRLGAPHKPAWVPGGNSLMQDEARRAADAILSLLSGAGTKSDGGKPLPIETAPRDGTSFIGIATAKGWSATKIARFLHAEDRLPVPEGGGMWPSPPTHWAPLPVVTFIPESDGPPSCADSGDIIAPPAKIPGPSDPSPGPDVRRRVLDILNAVAPAVENLAGHQEQCDMDGVMVKVSRQALDEVLNAVNEVALVSALTRPLGGTQNEADNDCSNY